MVEQFLSRQTVLARLESVMLTASLRTTEGFALEEVNPWKSRLGHFLIERTVFDFIDSGLSLNVIAQCFHADGQN